MTDKTREPTESEIAQSCMNYRHDFGLISDEEKKRMMLEAKEWLNAWLKVTNQEESR